ncbi:hypothetical protein GCM10010232_60390 [Streptomyces amakusaensis]|uniref:Uncharacterized protein n=1 Tax=Streptomyces amakusaensis TaxID=67271 RepID=A0ABW0AQB8_9ACTN
MALPLPEDPLRRPDPAGVDPAALGALLDRHGWRRRGGAPGRYAHWTPPGRTTGGAGLLVPESRSLPGCTDLLGVALTELARSAAPSAREVLLGLAVPSDEIHWYLDGPGPPQEPQAPVPGAAQERLRSAVRQTLMAGALAARGRAGYHGARHRRGARDSLGGVLVSPVRGGRALTAFLPVDTARTVTVRLHHALRATREAVDRRRATGDMEAFDAAVARGVSRELTEAVIALVRGSQGARIALEWSPAAPPPEGCPPRSEPVEFTPGDLPALREAGARFLRDEPSVAVRLTGTVVRLRRAGPAGPGTVRLRVLAGAEVPFVRAALEEEAYGTAGRAHLAGLPVRVSGRLESRGGFRRLTDATGIQPLHGPADAPSAPPP